MPSYESIRKLSAQRHGIPCSRKGTCSTLPENRYEQYINGESIMVCDKCRDIINPQTNLLVSSMNYDDTVQYLDSIND